MNILHLVLICLISNYFFANFILLIGVILDDLDSEIPLLLYLLFPLLILYPAIRFFSEYNFSLKKNHCLCRTCGTWHKTFNRKFNDEIGLK
jgi:hypothetical protein